MNEYEDFEELGKDNFSDVFWGWTEDEDGNLKFSDIVAENIIFGDTDSAGFSLEEIITDPEHDLDEVVEISDTIGNMVNETFPDFCQKVFNCPPDRKDTILTDREIVSDKSFFLTKKRYIMHVVDSEGKRGDLPLKIMGVEIKKSNTSTATKEMLLDLVNMILDGRDMPYVLNQIKRMKRDFRDRTPEEIATPLSVKSLRKSEGIFDMTGSMKGIWWGCRAAMFWNQIKTKHDPKVNSGEKVGLLYIKDQRSSYIGYPIDLISFPEWFNNDIVLDYDVMWKKVEKTLTNYLESMGWDVKSRKENQRKELFGF